jgi:gamma-glutamyltranspeptidase / glutathione hydrolase
MAKDSAAQDFTKGEAPRAYRPTVRGRRHMVSSGHYLASQAAFQILETGGNAVDAGVAGGLALGVVQSEFVNIAGVAPIVIYLAERDEVVTISGLGTWPKAATLELFLNEHAGTIPAGLRRTVVPAAPDAWITALANYGTMSFGEVATAAIRFAAEGVAVNPLMAEIIASAESNYRRWPSSVEVYLPNGRPPRTGELFVQADLARTLKYMVDEEAATSGGREDGLAAARAAFYEGDIARTIAVYHAENGGLLTMEDFAGFRVEIEPPQSTRFRDADIYSCGAWCQGPMLLEMLNLVEGLDLTGFGHNSPAYVHAVAEAMKLAFADRERYFGDPRFVDVPLRTLLSKLYAEARRRQIDLDRAAPEMPPPGEVAGFGAGVAAEGTRELVEETALDTSYVSVVDKHGNAFSATPSDSSAASPVIPGTGLCPSSRGYQAWAKPGHPSAIAPGKRPRLTPSPMMAIAPGRFVMPFGTPGNDAQCQAMLQVLLNLMVFGMEPQQAVEAPRFISFSFPETGEPHNYRPGQLNIEGRFPAETEAALDELGHKVVRWPEMVWRAGGVCLVHADRETGMLSGAADPRRVGYAVGW